MCCSLEKGTLVWKHIKKCVSHKQRHTTQMSSQQDDNIYSLTRKQVLPSVK
jgi:hypothetical protein